MLIDGREVSELVSKFLIGLLVREVFLRSEFANIDELRRFAIDRSLEAGTRFDPTISLLEWLGLLERKGGALARTSSMADLAECSLAESGVRLARRLIQRFFESDVGPQFSMSGAIVSGVGGEMLLRIARVPSRLLGVTVLMREFSILREKSPEAGILLFEEKYHADILERAGASLHNAPKRSMTLRALKEVLAVNEANGLKAEEFVVDFERKRLTAHPSSQLIQRISDFDVGAGFDILSFSSERSLFHDFFIEVKAHAGQPRFYWSAGEYRKARELGEAYAIYLVNISAISEAHYSPWVIRNPARLLDAPGQEWNFRPESWLFESVTSHNAALSRL